MGVIANQDDAIKLVAGVKKKKFSEIVVLVVGATGLVGREVVAILEERRFPIKELRLAASLKSAGEVIEFSKDSIQVQELKAELFAGVDLVFFAAGSKVTKEYLPHAVKAGAISIDKSSYYRLDKDVPLVIPEVNGDTLMKLGKNRLIATPNCSTIQLVQVLAPLHQYKALKRVIVSTYQAVSGAGKAGVDELETQVKDLFNFKDLSKTAVFGDRIAFNVLASIPSATNAFSIEDGFSEEEHKMMAETRKILNLKKLPITATCVRVPIFTGHSESIEIDFKEKITAEEARDILHAVENLVVIDDRKAGLYPTPSDAAGQDQTLVGRIRSVPYLEKSLALWCCSDNLRTGAALNAVRIAESLGQMDLY